MGGSEESTHYTVELITTGAGAAFSVAHTGDRAGDSESWPGSSATLHFPTLLEWQSYETPERVAPAPSALPSKGRALLQIAQGQRFLAQTRSWEVPPSSLLCHDQNSLANQET